MNYSDRYISNPLMGLKGKNDQLLSIRRVCGVNFGKAKL